MRLKPLQDRKLPSAKRRLLSFIAMAEHQYAKDMSEKGTAPLDIVPTVELQPLDEQKKGRWERSWPTIACGAGLFSDGYLNQVRIPS